MDIKALQKKLNSFSYITPKLEEDGFMGSKTTKAIKQFQKYNKLVADGILGPISLGVLNVESSPISISNYDIQPYPTDASLSLSELSLLIALSQEGVKELTGRNDGPAIQTYLSSIGLGPGFSWCMAFQYWCTDEAAKIKGIANPLVKTGGVLNQWKYTTCKKVTSNPKRGDIFIMDEGGGLGHTGRVISVEGDTIRTIEGNTNSASSREGNICAIRTRKQSTIKGYIRI